MWNKRIRIVCILLLLAPFAQAQTWNELFRQKKTQRYYLLEQIAALKVYAGYLKQGYALAHSGLGAIGDMTGREFNLHQTYIGSLSLVSPLVGMDPRIADVISMQRFIIGTFAGIKNHPMLSTGDLAYVNAVGNQMKEECGKDLQELQMVITSGKVVMKDDQRISRLDKVYESMRDKFAFTQKFCGQLTVLIRQRQLELNGAVRLQLMFNLKEQP